MKKNIEIFNTYPDKNIKLEKSEDVLTGIIKEENWQGEIEIRIILCNEFSIVQLNRQYAHKDSPTDILAFQFSEKPNNIEGEIYINLDRASEQAQYYNVTFENELYRLITHGLLHLLGYNDDTKENRENMHELENYYLNKYCKSS